MNHIKKYHIFENSQDTTEENIGICWDYLSTFSEMEDDFMLDNLRKGFWDYDFNDIPKSDKDKIVIIFNLSSNKEVKYNFNTNPDNKELDEVINLITKSKFLLGRLRRWCPEIRYEIKGKQAKFILLWPNYDEKEKEEAKLRKVFTDVKNCLDDWRSFKRASFSSKDKGLRAEVYQLLYNNNQQFKNYSKVGTIKELINPHDTITLAWSASESLDTQNKQIVVQVGRFKWKSWNLSKWFPISLNKDEIAKVMEVLKEIISGSYHLNDKSKLQYQIKGQKIIITLK